MLPHGSRIANDAFVAKKNSFKAATTTLRAAFAWAQFASDSLCSEARENLNATAQLVKDASKTLRLSKASKK